MDIREVTLDELRQIADRSRADLWNAAHSAGREAPLIILHWTAGWYHSYFPDDYHIEIGEHGEILLSTDDLSEVLAHTWKLNRGSVGVSLCCCVYATTEDLGEEPPTHEQIEMLAQVTAVLCESLWLTISPEYVMTHGEAADNEDLYDDDDLYGPRNGCERWDLEFLETDESPSFDPWATDGSRGGDVIRGKAAWYRDQWRQQAMAKLP